MANNKMVKKPIVEQSIPKKINKKQQKIQDDFCKEKGCRIFCPTCSKEVINMRSVLNKSDNLNSDECMHLKQIIPVSIIDTYCCECKSDPHFKDTIDNLAKKEYSSRFKK